MPKPIWSRKKTAGGGNKSARSRRAPAKSSSLSREVDEVTAETRRVKRAAAELEEKSGVVHQAADMAHHGAEALHREVEHPWAGTRRKPGAAKADDGHRAFPVVGIGASAGGFEAFVQLLEHLSPNTGMAYVFVQHLDPAHESRLTSLLAHATSMRVVEIRDRMRLEPDHVYVIPPNTALELSRGVLRLSPRRKNDPHLPVDQFFQSLARDQGNLAIG